MSNQNKIPTTVAVGEPPLTTPLSGSITTPPAWQRWFAVIGTWIKASGEVCHGDLLNESGSVVGSYDAVRSGMQVTVQGSIIAGTFNTYKIMGFPIKPSVAIPVLLSNGTAVLGADGAFTATTTGPTTFNATYIAATDKFTREQ